MTIALCPRQFARGSAAALTMVLALTLSGCDDNSPVAAPTSTLPAPASQPTPTVPPYETDLDLSVEEKEAVEGALVAFDGYIGTLNRVLTSGGADLENIDEFARDDSLDLLKADARDLQDNGKYLAGEYDYYNVRIHEVSLSKNSDKRSSVVVLYCSHDSKRSVETTGDPLPSKPPQSLTMKHTVTQVDNLWKISNQELWSEKCL